MSGEPFIERIFTLDGVEVACRFFQPRPDGNDFRCDYEISWPTRKRARSVMGIDAVQALLLALRLAHVDLEVDSKAIGGKLEWLEKPFNGELNVRGLYGNEGS